MERIRRGKDSHEELRSILRIGISDGSPPRHAVLLQSTRALVAVFQINRVSRFGMTVFFLYTSAVLDVECIEAGVGKTSASSHLSFVFWCEGCSLVV